ncbi:MAG TPA: zeta toxin family protein [Pyrinomonadaceae bacterium]|jgi:predicted ABC-type ATPase|nr:zeta toxin family protein [Pyrinomonadaceae bacterium]
MLRTPNSKPLVIAIAGPNGAGKTTLAPFLLRERFGITEYVNADTIALGLSAFRPEGAAFEAARVMLKRLRALADGGGDFAFETTLATRSYATWLEDLKRRGYSFQLIFLWLRNVELALERVKRRVLTGGHGVPEDVVRRRYVRGARNFFRSYQPLADSWVLYDNSVSGAEVKVAVGEGVSVTELLEESLWREFEKVAA